MEKRSPIACMSANVLKWIAIVSMLIDHIAASTLHCLLVDGIVTQKYWLTLYYGMRLVGRIAFPIFVFFLVEGFFQTHNRLKYAVRLAIFTLVSEVPFDMAFHGTCMDWSGQNVGLELMLAFFMLCVKQKLRELRRDSIRAGGVCEKFGKWELAFEIAMSLPIFVLFALLGRFCRADYRYGGIWLAYVLYWMKGYPIAQPVCGAVAFALYEPTGIVGGLLPVFYNGERGKQWKYFFYIFYPTHLLILGLIRILLLE